MNLKLTSFLLSCLFPCDPSLSGAPYPRYSQYLIFNTSMPTVPPVFSEMSFIPRKLVTVQVGRYLATVYPKAKPSMPVYEQAPMHFRLPKRR